MFTVNVSSPLPVEGVVGVATGLYVGCALATTGDPVGLSVGCAVAATGDCVGLLTGDTEGLLVGLLVVGASVGSGVGAAVVGASVAGIGTQSSGITKDTVASSPLKPP